MTSYPEPTELLTSDAQPSDATIEALTADNEALTADNARLLDAVRLALQLAREWKDVAEVYEAALRLVAEAVTATEAKP